MKIMCSKGCGIALDVSDEQVKEMVELGGAINAAHEVCPTDPQAPKKTYRIVTEVFVLEKDSNEKWLRLASAGGKAEAPSFALAVPALATQLQENWDLVIGMANTAEED